MFVYGVLQFTLKLGELLSEKTFLKSPTQELVTWELPREAHTSSRVFFPPHCL